MSDTGFPEHWLAVGFSLNDPLNGIAAGFWKAEPIARQSVLNSWRNYKPTGRMRIFVIFYEYDAIKDATINGPYCANTRFLKAAFSLLAYLDKGAKRP